MNESTILDNEFLFNKIKDLESAAAPNPEYHPGATETSVETSDMDYSDFAFGFSISGAVVTVISGTLRHSTRTPMAPFEVAETDVSIAADHSWIYVSYTFAIGTITIEQSPIEPQSTEAIFKQPLHRWRLISGAASIEKICHLGDISIPGSFA